MTVVLLVWQGPWGWGSTKRPHLKPGHLKMAFFSALSLSTRRFPLSIGGSQEGGFQKGGFGGCSPGTKTGTRVRSPKPPFWKPPFYLPVTLFGVDKRVVSKRVVSADVPPERNPERGYVRQNHPFTKPPFYLPVSLDGAVPVDLPSKEQSALTCRVRIFGPAPLQRCVGDFCCANFGGFCRGFSWTIFLGTFSHRHEEKKSGGPKYPQKIHWAKNKT